MTLSYLINITSRNMEGDTIMVRWLLRVGSAEVGHAGKVASLDIIAWARFFGRLLTEAMKPASVASRLRCVSAIGRSRWAPGASVAQATACWVGHLLVVQILERVGSGTMNPDTV